jgi:hypothetical protein
MSNEVSFRQNLANCRIVRSIQAQIGSVKEIMP